MSGKCEFTMTGKVTWFKDYPPRDGKPYGQMRIRLEIAGEEIKWGGQWSTVKPHVLFVALKYNNSDLSKAGLNTLRDRTVRGNYMVVTGNLIPRPKTEKYAASLNLETNYRNARVVHEASPPEPHNSFIFDGEVMAQDAHRIKVKYSYMNPKEKDPKLKWKEREFVMALPYQMTPRAMKSKVIIFGRVLGLNPSNGETLTWLLADKIL